MYERRAADAVLKYYASAVPCELTYEVVDLSGAFTGMESSLLLSGGEIPEGHYESSNMSKTVVPARNLVFLSILAGMAWSKGIENIAIGIHIGDHAIYPDCRPEFHKAMDTAIYLGTDRNVNILAPFLHMSKSQIVQYGIANNAPYHLTRTCYKNQPNPCGKMWKLL